MAQEAIARNEAAISAAEICDKLRPKLSTLMGATGFRALLRRALVLASLEAPSLRSLIVDTEGALVRADGATGQLADSNDIAGGVVLIAQLLSLLVAFIGEGLTMQLLVEIWPRFLADNSKFETGDQE